VDVAPDLRSRVPPRAVLFLIARSAGTHQIVAVRKEAEFALPFPFRISGRDAMMEGTSFEGPLEITARLSRTGEALPNAGDLEGTVRGVDATAHGIQITLDSVRR
jgi:cytochrome c-type biogenesis protein CcmH